MECNCWIGILNAYDQCSLNNLHINDYIATLKEKSDFSVKFNITFEGLCKASKPLDFLDRRRGMATLFNFCPYCGAKINWKDIKKRLNF